MNLATENNVACVIIHKLKFIINIAVETRRHGTLNRLREICRAVAYASMNVECMLNLILCC